MSAHTPGPWTFERVDLRTEGMADTTYQHIRAGHVGVADTYHSPPLAVEGFGQMSGYIPPRHGNAADARLIASAPDLLAACEAVLAAADAPMASGKRDGFTRPTEAQWLAIVTATRAAIAKTRGE